MEKRARSLQAEPTPRASGSKPLVFTTNSRRQKTVGSRQETAEDTSPVGLINGRGFCLRMGFAQKVRNSGRMIVAQHLQSWDSKSHCGSESEKRTAESSL